MKITTLKFRKFYKTEIKLSSQFDTVLMIMIRKRMKNIKEQVAQTIRYNFLHGHIHREIEKKLHSYVILLCLMFNYQKQRYWESEVSLEALLGQLSDCILFILFFLFLGMLNICFLFILFRQSFCNKILIRFDSFLFTHKIFLWLVKRHVTTRIRASKCWWYIRNIPLTGATPSTWRRKFDARREKRIVCQLLSLKTRLSARPTRRFWNENLG